jgi:glycerate dehydrogenase
MELANKTLGIIGFGGIGQATARIATAFGMKVIVYNRTKRLDLETERLKFVEFEEVLSQSDFISLHCPLTDNTKDLINKETLAKMKDGVFLINTARGPIINEQDVADALNNDKLAGVGVDVVSIEPIPDGNPLLKAKNCIITPHFGWAPFEARTRLMDTLEKNIKAYIENKPINVVNN